MSDPVTSAEVEDVLSSIRRLVSEDKRPLQAAQTAPTNDRLVLTPALRVSEAAPSEDEASEQTEPAPDHFVLSADQRLEETPVAEVPEETAEDIAEDYGSDPYNFGDDSDEEGEGDFTTSFDDDAAESVVFEEGGVRDETSTEDETADHDDHETSDWPDEPAVEVNDTAATTLSQTSKADVLRAKIEELESAIGSISGNWGNAGEGGQKNPTPADDALAWEEASPEDAIPSKLHVFDPDAPIADDDPAIGIGLQTDTPEPYSPSPVETSHVTHAQHDKAGEVHETKPVDESIVDAAQDAVRDHIQTPEFQSQTVAAATAAVALGKEEQILDEEALRDLVSDIVRSELQGALGERITRNVRKLVRREIHRALTTQDLE